MKTSKSISTISYNTIPYLEFILNNMVDNGVIDFYAYIFHQAEENEKKNHIHLYIEPSNRIDTFTLKKQFEEIDVIGGNDKPLGVMPFNSSNFKDWYLYSIHDLDYLRSKGLSREYMYNKENVVVSDELYFAEKINTIDYNYGVTGKIIEAVNSGVGFNSLIVSGVVKVSNVCQAERIYNLLSGAKIENNYKHNENS